MSPYNFVDEVKSQMKLPKRVKIVEMSLRDGEQTLGVSYRKEEKVRITKELDEVGIHEVEFSCPDMVDVIREVSKLCLRADIISIFPGYLKNWKSIIDQGISVGVTRVCASLPAPSSPFGAYVWARDNSQKTMGTEDDWVNRAVDIVKHVKSKGVPVGVSIVDATRTSMSSIKRFFRAAVDAGTDRIKICDSFGCCGTAGWRYLVREVKKDFPNTPLQVHAHNDLGQANGNALAAVEEGAEIIDTTLNGLGERAGNPHLAEVAVALKVLYGIDTGIKLEKLRSISLLIADLSRYPIPPNKPLVGEYAFADGADIHIGAYAYGLERGDPFVLDPVKPELVGNRRRIELSRYSGEAIVKARAHMLGIMVPDIKLSEVAQTVRCEVESRKRILTDEDFKHIVESLLR